VRAIAKPIESFELAPELLRVATYEEKCVTKLGVFGAAALFSVLAGPAMAQHRVTRAWRHP
jgi:hypothetical protein